jgi:hypothetical protein
MNNSLEQIGPFGPKIVKSKLSQETTEALYNMCLQSNIPENNKLVGFIKEENGLTHLLKQNAKVHNELISLIERYFKEIESGIYKKVLAEKNFSSLLELTSGWYNKQVAMEYNPPHNHNTAADLVCVIYPKIQLDDNADLYTVNPTTDKEQKGQISFMYAQSLDLNGFTPSILSIQPEEGDILIFPSSLLHFTAPVLGESFRYSISCNFNIHSHIQYLARKHQVRGLKQ